MATFKSDFGNSYPSSVAQEDADYLEAVRHGIANPLMWARDLDGYFDNVRENLQLDGLEIHDPSVVHDVVEEYVRLFTYDRAHHVDLQDEPAANAAARFERSLILRGIRFKSFNTFMRARGGVLDAAEREDVAAYYAYLGGPFRLYDDEVEDLDEPDDEPPLDALIRLLVEAILPSLLSDRSFLQSLARRVIDD